jgi:hypothetical protein
MEEATGRLWKGIVRERLRHLDSEEAERYLMGHCRETAALEEHLLVCHSCRARIRNTDVYLASMSGAAAVLRARQAARTEGHWQLSRLLAVVVALACILLLVILTYCRP